MLINIDIENLKKTMKEAKNKKAAAGANQRQQVPLTATERSTKEIIHPAGASRQGLQKERKETP